jgi:hypothetical protein
MIARIAIVIALGLAASGCGQDFRAPALETTGVPASPLGQVIDVEGVLPHLRLPDTVIPGITMEIRLEMQRVEFGELDARVSFGPARVDWSQTEMEIEDLSDGRITVFVTDQRWTTDRLGPLRIGNTIFEVVLDGAPERGGRYLSGRTWESLSGLEGTFEGWRRHRFLSVGTDFFSSVGRVAEIELVKEREIRTRNGLEIVSSDCFPTYASTLPLTIAVTYTPAPAPIRPTSP